jgi:hypothetical protein
MSSGTIWLFHLLTRLLASGSMRTCMGDVGNEQLGHAKPTLRRRRIERLPGPAPSDWVFSNGAGGILDESRGRKQFAKAMQLAGLSGHRLYNHHPKVVLSLDATLR